MSGLSESLGGSLSRSLLGQETAAKADPAALAPKDGKSYVSGDRSILLLRKTIPQAFAETVRYRVAKVRSLARAR